MPIIEMQDFSLEFANCWNAVGEHLQKMGGEGLNWLKCWLSPPFLEHFSFRIGNQLFFVRIIPEDAAANGPATTKSLLYIADSCNGHACLLPMKRSGIDWTPELSGWGLVDARTYRPVDPFLLVSDELIDMTNWELQDFAVQVVKDALIADGRKIMYQNGNPDVDPSIWFEGKTGPEWVKVDYSITQARNAMIPGDMSDIGRRCLSVGKVGYYTSVIVAPSKLAIYPKQIIGDPKLWRGFPINIQYFGLKKVFEYLDDEIL